jgi:mannose-6-phosphate isomerase-like protein (cupin superfamily)
MERSQAAGRRRRLGGVDGRRVGPGAGRTAGRSAAGGRRALGRDVEVRSRDDAEPFTTADGSTIRVLLDAEHGGATNQSLAEATLSPGQATERHYHGETEEIYVVLEGAGQMEVDGDRRRLGPGDAILIPPRAWHQIRAGDAQLRFLCCCSPRYRHEDTFFA